MSDINTDYFKGKKKKKADVITLSIPEVNKVDLRECREHRDYIEAAQACIKAIQMVGGDPSALKAIEAIFKILVWAEGKTKENIVKNQKKMLAKIDVFGKLVNEHLTEEQQAELKEQLDKAVRQLGLG
jgi:hypothetical protein